ncbi:MAG TPA: hypothetical protein VFN38_13445 [Gemmatimonadaceae bacterium]|nr:hypothetical protein [Gemmatimonadaceae bacterium]
MLRRIFDRGNRIGTAYALTTFARVLPGRADELEAYLGALPRGTGSPFARIGTLHIARVQLFRSLVHQGPKQRRTDVLQNAHLVFTSTIDGELDAYLDALCAHVPECDEWWGRCAGYPGRDDAAAFRAYVRSIQARPGLFQSAMPSASVTVVRESLALREQVIDFAVAAQGLDAAELQARFRAEF